MADEARAKTPKIIPAASLDDISGGNDIAKAMKPTASMMPVSMAESISTNEEVTTGIPMGLAMPPMQMVPTANVPRVVPPQIVNEDAKYGKAFQVATKTAKKLKVASLPAFLELVEEIKNNL